MVTNWVSIRDGLGTIHEVDADDPTTEFMCPVSGPPYIFGYSERGEWVGGIPVGETSETLATSETAVEVFDASVA